MDTPPEASPLWARLLLFLSLVVVAGFALPVAAFFVEAVSARAENWILWVHLVLVVLVAATIGPLVPKSSSAPTRRGRAVRWAVAGVLAAGVAYAVWLLLLAG